MMCVHLNIGVSCCSINHAEGHAVHIRNATRRLPSAVKYVKNNDSGVLECHLSLNYVSGGSIMLIVVF